ncbi:hypothetical protein AMTR_s00005p00239690 [Amborella trichopoda]|uniref:Uncharacterized protein n=1 Tax=Amborella trichopoda TaxID=13333 RepID=W1PFX6_AMBTC|nr:hypothetical protein AMTR_s00005p00239690 [Amborella trichopoda]
MFRGCLTQINVFDELANQVASKVELGITDLDIGMARQSSLWVEVRLTHLSLIGPKAQGAPKTELVTGPWS